MKHTLYAALAAVAAKWERVFAKPKPQTVRLYACPRFGRVSGVAAARRAAKKRRARHR